MSTKAVMIYVTFPNQEIAVEICHSLLEEKLIACANIFPAHLSVYKWNDKINQELEIAALLKTRSELFEPIQQKILSRHPYECPCITMLPLEKVSAAFLEWIHNQTIRH